MDFSEKNQLEFEIVQGNKFCKISNYVFEETGLRENLSAPFRDIYFVKSDLIECFFREYAPKEKFILITHNGDLNITEKHKQFLNHPYLFHWFGQNIKLTHPKLTGIPIGIANEIWSHGDESLIKSVIIDARPKSEAVYVNFDFRTNKIERLKCIFFLALRGIFLQSKVPFKKYLEQLAISRFCISPEGNGLDCHRFWECIYLKTIPIVKSNTFYKDNKDLPVIIINSWLELLFIKFDEDHYNSIMVKHDYKKISFNFYRSLIEKKYHEMNLSNK